MQKSLCCLVLTLHHISGNDLPLYYCRYEAKNPPAHWLRVGHQQICCHPQCLSKRHWVMGGQLHNPQDCQSEISPVQPPKNLECRDCGGAGSAHWRNPITLPRWMAGSLTCHKHFHFDNHPDIGGLVCAPHVLIGATQCWSARGFFWSVSLSAESLKPIQLLSDTEQNWILHKYYSCYYINNKKEVHEQGLNHSLQRCQMTKYWQYYH